MPASEAPQSGFRHPNVGCGPTCLRRGVGRPVRRGDHLLFDVVIHDDDIAKIDHPYDLHREALPIDTQSRSDPLVLVQSPKRTTADEHESVANELFQEPTIMAAHSVLKPIRFMGWIEFDDIHKRTLSQLQSAFRATYVRGKADRFRPRGRQPQACAFGAEASLISAGAVLGQMAC